MIIVYLFYKKKPWSYADLINKRNISIQKNSLPRHRQNKHTIKHTVLIKEMFDH